MATRLAAWAGTQVLAYAGVRLLSAGMSFYMFALLARLYAPAVTADCYFFLFIFGFLAAALRMAANINAGVSPTRTRTANLRSIQRANCIALLGALVAAPWGALLLEPHSRNLWLLFAAMAILVPCAIDFDLPRALTGKGPLFPAAFAAGSTLAVGLLVMAPGKSPELAIAAILTQWVPAGFLGIKSLLRMGWRPLKKALRRMPGEVQPLAWGLAVALFDGLILNAPFFLGTTLPDTARIDVSVVIRIFSASLLFSPLILHWSNSPALGELGNSFSLTPEKTYFALQIVLSFFSAVVFITAYTLVSGQQINAAQYAAVAVLLVSYCFYTTSSRHQGGTRPTAQRAFLCAALLLSFILLASQMSSSLGVLPFSLLQGGALLLGAWLLRHNRGR
jgi:hypothetical protein